MSRTGRQDCGRWSTYGSDTLAKDLAFAKRHWVSTSKGWLLKPRITKDPKNHLDCFWIRLYAGRCSFYLPPDPRISRNPSKRWDYTDPEELAYLYQQVVFNNSQNVRRIKKK